MPDFWTSYPAMLWWKWEPHRILRSRTYRKMPYQSKGPYRQILDEMMCDNAPYGILKYSDELLAELAGLSPEEWILEKPNILKAFRLYKDGTIHHETIKEKYREACQTAYQSYERGKRGPYERALKNKVRGQKVSSPTVLEWKDPYSEWDGMPSERADVAILEGGDKGGLWGGSEGGDNPRHVQKEEKEEKDKNYLSPQTADATAPEADGVAARGERLGALLKRSQHKANGGQP